MPLSEFAKLTSAYPDKEFCLSYFDGHSSFISNNLIERTGFTSQNHKALKTGIIVGEAERDEILKHIPTDNEDELRKMALYAQEVFIKNEVNRVRHMTSSEDHWNCLKKLENEGLLKIKIEVFFSEFMGQTLDEAINAFNSLKSQSSEMVTASGIKLFYDGAFGSDTAYTSLEETTLPRCEPGYLRAKMQDTFVRTDAPIAVHTIGDKALEDVITMYSEIAEQNDAPPLHLEHAPIFSKKVLKILEEQELDCVFHFQPSHWINDHDWYTEHKDKLQEHEIYPFKFLLRNGYAFHFGSDAPVVDCSQDHTIRGLQMIEDDRTAQAD